MAAKRTQTARTQDQALPVLPLRQTHWKAIVEELRLSAQEARVVELTIRGAARKQVAAIMGISEPTVGTYLLRVREKTGTHGTMELALCVLGVSHSVGCECRRK